MDKKICIFCGAKTGQSAQIIHEVEALCDLLIEQKYDLVYGGGKSGLMGIVADKFLAAKRQVIGVRPEKLIIDEDAHDKLAELIVVKDMHERKAKMVDLSDVFVALPGGVGTLDEIVETFTLFKIGFIDKPSGILNVDGYYDGLITLLDRMVTNGFLDETAKNRLMIEAKPTTLVARIKAF
ncbi:MAG: TIGR00730 family Rossman fold protein [Bacteroidota bacterium]